jgi:hypothetical protein
LPLPLVSALDSRKLDIEVCYIPRLAPVTMAVLFSSLCRVLANVLVCDSLKEVLAEAAAWVTALVLCLAAMMGQCR